MARDARGGEPLKAAVNTTDNSLLTGGRGLKLIGAPAFLTRIREWLFGPKVDTGCGCTLCDMGLKPKEYFGFWFHLGRPGQLIECSNPTFNK